MREKNTKGAMRDLTVGNPMTCLLGFWFPVFLGTLFQQIYNMVDTMIVGRYLGINQLAGVGLTGCLNFLVLGLCIGICNGFAIPVAQAFGAKDYSSLRRYVTNGVWYCVFLAVLVTTVTVLLCGKMLTWMNTPEAAYPYAYEYLVIIFAGIPFIILYNMASGILRSLGDSRSPVVFLVISSIVNIGLDLLFIPGMKMGVGGAALATVIAQSLSGIAATIYLVKHFDVMKMQEGDWRIRGEYMKKLTVMGLPMGLQYSITAIGSVVLQTAVNSFGEIAVAGVAAGSKLYCMISCPHEAMGSAMATYVGQNMGAGKFDRIRKGVTQSTLFCFVLSVVIFVIMFFFGRYAMLLFIEGTQVQAIEYAYQYIMASVIGFPLLTIVLTFRFSIQGMGFSPFAMIAGVLEMIARCFAAMVLPAYLGFTSVCLANVAAWIAADIFLIPAVFYCLKKVAGERQLSKTRPISVTER